MGLSWESFFQMVPLILASDWLKQICRPIRGQDKVGYIIWSPVFRWYLEILACDWLKQERYHLKSGLLAQTRWRDMYYCFPDPNTKQIEVGFQTS